MQELRAECDELRNRQGNVKQLREQIQYLQVKFNNVQDEKNKIDRETSQKLFEGMQVVDQLIKELEDLRQLNSMEEDNQISLLQQLHQQCTVNDQKAGETARNESTLLTAQADGDKEQRELEYLVKQVRQQQSVSLNQNERMAELREKAAAKEDSNEASRYQVKSMHAEIESSRARIHHQEDVLEQREDEQRAT